MAQVVKAYRFTRRFKKAYQKLPADIQQAFDQKLILLMKDISHPSLRIKQIQGAGNRWEGSVTMKYRFTFQWDRDVLIFRAIGTHAILSRESKR
jgi:mRNA interferase RelE/StbE